MKGISECIQDMHVFFYHRNTYPINLRINYLKKLRSSILLHQEAITKALYKDFKKPKYETYTTEIYTTLKEIDYALKHIRKWCKSKKHPGVFPLIGSSVQVKPEPYGVCLIFSPFNYPFQLSLVPLVGALAAGNCAIIKPSEYTPNTSEILSQIIKEVFPYYYVNVIEGDAELSHSLLSEPIDYIFFTGGAANAKKVMQQAAAQLIPITLELGGKSPVIVDYNADIPLAAKRIVWGKFLNAGQTCIAPDYVLVYQGVADKLLRHIGYAIKHFYTNDKYLARIINETHYVRLLNLIDEEKIYFGGHFNTDDLYIEPTVLYPIDRSDACMKEEIFGPILPIIPFEKINDVIKMIHRYPKPLACYIFSKDRKRINYFLKHLSFGGGCINDTVIHAASLHAPFGGIGHSGLGAYHGYHSFKTFSHYKTILKSTSTEIPLRYPPYDQKIATLKKIIR
ncbi:aldehyde dehydrogenase family protein [Cellulosilyticum sp. I15G10I2]|uniref:aldehyde dehydrogenase family protein n=1 Tax=Cellulosilyticum sp. I15G10I2 TaxID=1892843 RepID=UPI00085C4925|nr:aldehyde dehydrogenase family protein [Cellulosilyticum sp. I15G10I2]